MLSKIVKVKIEKKFGRAIRYTKDCEKLSEMINEQCKCKISATTIKRLFGLTKEKNSPRIFTLDVLSTFLGYSDYDELVNELVEAKKSIGNKINFVETKKVKIGTRLRIWFGHIAKIDIIYEGKGIYRVLHRNKITLEDNDLLEIDSIKLEVPVLVKRIVRDGISYSGIVLGKVSGVTEIIKL